jgi:hypothetical protein
MLSSPVRSVLYVVVVAVRSRLHLSLTCLNRARALLYTRIRFEERPWAVVRGGSMGERESSVVSVLFTKYIRCGGGRVSEHGGASDGHDVVLYCTEDRPGCS